MGAPTALPDVKPEDDVSLEALRNDGDGGVMHEKGGTSVDAADMTRMGKKQELRRNFKFVGIVGFVTILQATWENVLLSNWFGLYNGTSSLNDRRHSFESFAKLDLQAGRPVSFG